MKRNCTQPVSTRPVQKDMAAVEYWANREANVLLEQLARFANTESPLNVLRFGAVADGATDNRAAFQAASDAAAVTGGTIDVPEGEYIIRGGSVTFGNNTFLRGAGRTATKITFISDVTTDGFVWDGSAAPNGLGGGISDMTIGATDIVFVRDVLVVSFWQDFSAARLIITLPGRYGVFAPDGLNCTFIDVRVNVPVTSGFWVGDYVYASGLSNNYNVDGLHCDLTATATPAANEWVGRVIVFIGGTFRTITANTASNPSTITWGGVALTGPERAALTGTTASVKFGSVATTIRFLGCYSYLALNGPAFDLQGISIDCYGCVCEASGAVTSAPAVLMRSGIVNWAGGHLENNRQREFELGTEGPSYAVIIDPLITAGGNKAISGGVSGVHGGPYLFGGGWFGGDMRNGGLANTLDLDAGGYGFALKGVDIGAKLPTYNGGSIDDYRGQVEYMDPSSGTHTIAGSLRLKSAVLYDNRDVALGQEGTTLATAATDGHVFIPSCAGVPTGVPSAHTGKGAIIMNSLTGVLYCYSTTLAAWVPQV